MNPDKVIQNLEKFFFWGSVVMLVMFLFTVHILKEPRAPLAKEEYYRLGLYDEPILYPTPPPYVPVENWVTEAERNEAAGDGAFSGSETWDDTE